MVQQAYIHRLALGRSAFEPPIQARGSTQIVDDSSNIQDHTPSNNDSSSSEFSQTYDNRGHPQNPLSRSRVRRNIRAYNEVLATVDVCARVDAEGKDLHPNIPLRLTNDKDDSYIEENEIGFWLSFLNELLRIATTTVTTNLRRRIQTFDFYQGIPFLTVVRVETLHHSFLQVFFAGHFANLVGGILEDTTNSLIGIVRGMLIDRFVSTENGTSQRPYLSFAIHTTERLLKLGSLCLYFPLQYHAALQRLNLIPLWPLLPNPFMKPLSSIILPPVPRGWDRRSLASWGTALFMSPVVTAIGMHFFVDIISNRLLHYSRAAMLRPDNPDPVSYRMIQADSMDGSSVVLDFSRLQTTIGAEIRKDINAFTQGASELKALLRNAARKLFFARRPSVGFPDLIEQNATRKSDSIYRPMIPEDFENSVNESITDSELIPISTDHPPTVPASPPLLSPTSSQRDDESEGGITSNVRIRTRTGSTSTLHMDVEFDTSARAGGAVHTSSFAASPHHGMISETVLPGSTSNPFHRVTSLSLHAADSLAINSMLAIGTFLRLPLEACYVRVIARSYLSTQAASPSWLLERIYPSNCWFGRTSSHPGWDYAGKILLCLGIESIATFQVWQTVCDIAFWAGEKWYDWGKL